MWQSHGLMSAPEAVDEHGRFHQIVRSTPSKEPWYPQNAPSDPIQAHTRFTFAALLDRKHKPEGAHRRQAHDIHAQARRGSTRRC